METLNDFDKKNNEQSNVANRLLIDMVNNQKENNKSMVKLFIITVICYTILLIAMVVGHFVYESQFELIDGEYETMTTQEADSDGDGIAIVNNGGDVNYGESKTDNNN